MIFKSFECRPQVRHAHYDFCTKYKYITLKLVNRCLNIHSLHCYQFTDRPEVATTAAKLSQLKGKEAILECKVRANPYQKFIWNRDGEALPHLPWKYKKEV